MKTSGIRTLRRPKAGAAAATALTAALLLAVPGATNAAPLDTPAFPGWVAGGTIAPGVERMHLRDEDRVTTPAKPRKAPRELTVIRIDPSVASLRIESTTGNQAGTAETVRAQLKDQERKPFAAINGSFFSLEGRDKDRAKDSAQSFGAAVRDGVVMGAGCVDERASLILQHGVPRIANLSTVMSVAQKGAAAGTPSFTLDDVNRVPGVPLACQREPEDGVLKGTLREPVKYNDVHGKPTAAWPDTTEFVLFTDSYGIPTPAKGSNNNNTGDPVTKEITATNVVTADDQDGFEVEVDANGKITNSWAVRGDRMVKRGYRNLQAIGTAEVNWLKSMAAAHATLDIVQTVKDVDLNQPMPLDESVDIVSGGAILMKDGVDKQAPDRCSRLDPKVVDPKVPVTQICRSARTAVGVDQQGRTLLVTVTGPLVPSSPADKVDGAWFTEVVGIMQSLGAMDVINLDGGGSTTLLTRPLAEDTLIRETGLSDAGERAVFDTV